jgi:hypothetical protein
MDPIFECQLPGRQLLARHKALPRQIYATAGYLYALYTKATSQRWRNNEFEVTFTLKCFDVMPGYESSLHAATQMQSTPIQRLKIFPSRRFVAQI